MKKLRILLDILLGLMILLGFAALFSALWYINTYGLTGFDSILFTLFSNLGGAESGLVKDWLLKALLPTFLCALPLSVFLLYRGKKSLLVGRRPKKIYPFPRWLSSAFSLFISIVLIYTGATMVRLPQWLKNTASQTTVFEENYIEPNESNITFPNNKRNLIYIFLESMETSYLSKELGGGAQVNLIPKMTELAKENINFSQNSGVGGFCPSAGGTWTVGAMVSQTAGVPLSIHLGNNSYGADGGFLPNLTTLSDILNQNGYKQALMVGSDADYGGRKTYYSSHKTDEIYDIFTARTDGIIPEDYHVWWGMEDIYLYKYAKQKLAELSSGEQPFAFTMLTVDTHHVGGYICSQCKNSRTQQYENVISCADRQLYSFIEWLKEQPFYENTTIVICGDHASMDNDYFTINFDSDYERRIYNCIINSAVSTEHSKNREFTTIDMFPTTLAAMGCTIENERLGLGTNLFSGEPTLAESMGLEAFQAELQKNSVYYKRFY